jgi:hypothetical protein
MRYLGQYFLTLVSINTIEDIGIYISLYIHFLTAPVQSVFRRLPDFFLFHREESITGLMGVNAVY